MYGYARRTREWYVCIVRSMVAPSVARISTECGVQMRKADARGGVCARRQGRPRLPGLSNPPLSLAPSLFQPCLRVCGLCQVWLSNRSCRVPKGSCNDCSQGTRNMKARILHARATLRGAHGSYFYFGSLQSNHCKPLRHTAGPAAQP